ncbi:MAG: hypothetical protein U0Z44_19315 [Kouleothrix sp.]
MGERLALNKLKQLAGQFVVALPGSAVLRSSVHRATTLDAARGRLNSSSRPTSNRPWPAPLPSQPAGHIPIQPDSSCAAWPR